MFRDVSSLTDFPHSPLPLSLYRGVRVHSVQFMFDPTYKYDK